MVLRVGVILGSGRGSESTTGRVVEDLVVRLAARAPASSRPVVESVAANDIDLGPSCPACLSCMTSGEAACPNYDPAAPVRRVLDHADVMVFATPVHSFQVSASMKRLIDHFAYLIHRPAYVGKPAVLISTAAGGGHDAALGYLKTAVRRWGFHTVAQLGVNGPALARPAYRLKVERALDEVADTMVAAPGAPEPRPTVADLIGFRVARILVDAGRAEGPADAAYWDERGWFEADWWSDRKAPFLANRVARRVEAKIRTSIERGAGEPYRG